MSVEAPGPPPSTPPVDARQPSQFTYNHLYQLRTPLAYLLPLAVVGFIDQNAFFAQVEQHRLGKSRRDPVVCAQWDSLIAVLYAARAYGISRMDLVALGKEKCPELVVGHAAVYTKGSLHWRYPPEGEAPDRFACKVLLDPYRRELRKILACLAGECPIVQKASVDELYMDMGPLIIKELEKLDWIDWNKSGDEILPSIETIPKAELPHFIGEVVEQPTLEDWDDVVMALGSQLVYKLRQKIESDLQYLTSGGVARTKLVAKLAGGFHKPDNQTVVPNKALPTFLAKFKYTDIGGQGGQEGQHTLQLLGVPPDETDQMGYIRSHYDLRRLQAVMGASAGAVVHARVRGAHHEPIKHQTAVKQMISRKNLNGKALIRTMGDAADWLEVFVGDLVNRIHELDDEHLGSGACWRPKTMLIHLNLPLPLPMIQRQTKLPVTLDLERLRAQLSAVGTRLLQTIFADAFDLLRLNGGRLVRQLWTQPGGWRSVRTGQVIGMGCGASNFVETSATLVIDNFVLAPKAVKRAASPQFSESEASAPALATPPALALLLLGPSPGALKAPPGAPQLARAAHRGDSDRPAPSPRAPRAPRYKRRKPQDIRHHFSGASSGQWRQVLQETGYCERCQQPADAAEHLDWHVAVDLQERLNGGGA